MLPIRAVREVIRTIADGPLSFFITRGLSLRPQDYDVYRLLRDEWQIPEDLACCGVLLPWIEHGEIDPPSIAIGLGAASAQVAEAVQRLATAELRPTQHAVATQWRLFMLARLCPAAAMLTIGRLLSRLRSVESGISADQAQIMSYVADHLGMWDVRREILNHRVQILDLAQHRRASRNLSQHLSARHSINAALFRDLARRLTDAGIGAQIQHHAMQIYQIVDESHDGAWGEFVGTGRVVVLADDLAGCYGALGVINVAYQVIGIRLRDYIGGPKANGYQAIHTCIRFPDPERDRLIPIELIICTPAMDDLNRRGIIAALSGHVEAVPPTTWWRDQIQQDELLNTFLERSDTIFVFTPTGEPIMLPRGATVLDFAVRVHSDLGVYCRGARLNGQRTLPGEQLACGDICEVLIDPDNVQIDHTTLRRTTTSLARSKVRRALQQGANGAARGRECFLRVLEHRLNDLNIRTNARLVDQLLLRFCAQHAYERPEAFYQTVARGEAAPDEAVGMIVEQLLKPRLIFANIPDDVSNRIISVTLGRCCWPAPGAETAAVLLEKKGTLRARVHRVGCLALAELAQKPGARSYPVSWAPAHERGYVADLLYEGRDEQSLIFQITRDITALHEVNITSFEASVPEPHLARVTFSCEAADERQLTDLIQQLRARPGQRRVEFNMRPLHDDELTINEPLFNPYTSQPSATYPLFVGREAEIRRIIPLVSGPMGMNHALIRGPKRIGKSSLLQNLALYHLPNLRKPSLLNLQTISTDDLPIAHLLNRIARMLPTGGGLGRAYEMIDPQQLRHDPVGAFGAYVERLRILTGPERFVVLIDEFGVIESRFSPEVRQEQLQMWRGLLTDERVRRHLSFIIAAPDGVAPQIGEVCTAVRLEVLSDAEARDLIVTPVHAHLQYLPGDVSRIVRATGGHPFYTHLVCSEIVSRLIGRQSRAAMPPRRQFVPNDVIDEALAHVQMNEDAFHHVLHDSDPETITVLRALANAPWAANHCLTLEQIQRLNPMITLLACAHACEQRRDLLLQIGDLIELRIGLVAARLRTLWPSASTSEVGT